MKILIIGAGAVGFNLAKQLSKEGHDISVIEKSSELVKRITEKLDVFVVQGAPVPDDFEERASKMPTVLSVTNSDEINMVACTLAHNYGVKTKIARIRNPSLPMNS